MSVKTETLQEICYLAGRQVQELYPNLTTMFIPHAAGAFHEIVSLDDHAAIKHPAGKIARTILEKNNNREKSSFLGMAINHQVKWMGLASKDSMLALFNLNTDDLTDAKDMRRTVYHLLWHAIDLLEVRRRPEYVSKFRSGPMIPKRSPMNLARLNLQADVFAAVMSGLQGEEDALDIIARQRAHDSISPVNDRRAEDFPFVIALESARYAFAELLALKPQKSKYMHYARQLSGEIGRTFDDKSIRQWWSFSEPAQDMAWRNIAKDLILGCAVHTSEDPFVRATAHLVSDIANVTPVAGLRLQSMYNAFASHEANQILHREIMERTFEEAIAQGVMEDSGKPLIAAANLQNENLAEGVILGWCGHALQSAARAFENAVSTGMSPTQAARLEFEGSKDATSWETLRKIGSSIVDQKRKGYAVTLGNIAEIANTNPDFAPLLGSIKITMKDPSYIQKLQAANDLTLQGHAPSGPAIKGPAPKGPAPKGPAPQAPTYSAPAAAPPMPAGPGLGGNTHNTAAARHRAYLEQLRRADAAKKTTGEEDRVQ
jgi:hypothetical protein